MLDTLASAAPFPADAPEASLVFRLATPADRAGIERLNHATFAGELPQHAPTASGLLPDRFAADMTYVVAVEGDTVVGMIGLGEQRPFSLDHKLPGLDVYLPPHRAACEVRLLAVDPARRGGTIFRGLVAVLAERCLARGYDLAVISGTTRQLRLYRHLGFEPFGPVVGTPEVPYQPMYLTLDRFRPHAATFGQAAAVPAARNATGPTGAPARFLPGPVALRPAVRAALNEPPVSHRGAAFRAELAEGRRRLRALTGAAHVAVLTGSGTLANDVVGGQLRRLGTPGAVLACGAFGDRLAAQAARWGLAHRVVRKPWGTSFTRADVEAALADVPESGWLWTPLCETSTGVLLDATMLRAACAARGIHLALDAVSAIGSVDVDLADVWMASGTSGKGLGSLAGLALVFHRDPVAPADDLPAYLDLGLYAQDDGVAFTQPSVLVHALAVALATNPSDTPARVAADAVTLRHHLRAAGLALLADGVATNPAVTTVVLPEGRAAEGVGRAVRRAGFEIACESAYLQERGWVQVCLMGAYDAAQIPGLASALAAAVYDPGR